MASHHPRFRNHDWAQAEQITGTAALVVAARKHVSARN